ncbi:hypothetical protein CEXT_600691 [Caerostris extrusa]|uniref:Uncharacterized protein n=1 Tax=Caerostris extrusa TaxID=172846 RepID=A0AAV4NIE5_CAEEX|nr:hypothetical protein CEXT_600691 [Caerostris extrusa]
MSSANDISTGNIKKSQPSVLQTNVLRALTAVIMTPATLCGGRSREMYKHIPTRTSFQKVILMTLNNPKTVWGTHSEKSEIIIATDLMRVRTVAISWDFCSCHEKVWVLNADFIVV